jgi:BMFP domain-containing protein YqiC
MAEIDDPRKDFDASALLQEHGKGISSLDDRVGALEKKLSNPELLAKTLEEAASDSKRLDKLFSKIFCDMMKNDTEVKTSVEDKINALDRSSVKSAIRKFGGLVGFAVWSVFLIVLTALLTALFEHHIGGK